MGERAAGDRSRDRQASTRQRGHSRRGSRTMRQPAREGGAISGPSPAVPARSCRMLVDGPDIPQAWRGSRCPPRPHALFRSPLRIAPSRRTALTLRRRSGNRRILETMKNIASSSPTTTRSDTKPPVQQPAGRYFIECSPIMLPSESFPRAMKPCGPIANLSFMMLPPLARTRDASTAQSSHSK